MFRRSCPPASKLVSFPRIRGDVPGLRGFYGIELPFSPHTRGCSVFLGVEMEQLMVFPAYAGMFRVEDLAA